MSAVNDARAQKLVNVEAGSIGAQPRRRRRRWLRRTVILFLFLAILLLIGRLLLPGYITDYVNRTLDQNLIYEGKIGTIDVHLWRGAYVINDIRISKRTGNVPVPLFSAKRVDLAIQWDALWHRKIVGQIKFEQPQVNFVDSGSADASQGQSGAGGPWLSVIRDLFPFDINSAAISGGTIHFRAFNRKPPFDVYLSHVDATVNNLTNVRDENTPDIATIKATALAVDQARFEMQMKLNPFSYRPSFQLATRLIGLDVTQLNSMVRAYGKFDFEKGFFDLVIQLHSHNGQLEGYVKPLFRNVAVFSLDPDLKEDNIGEFFWEALVGAGMGMLKNPPRDQFATVIPVTGDIGQPNVDMLQTLGNVLRNAFIRAYLPEFQPTRGPSPPAIDVLQFGQGSITDPSVVGKDQN